MRGRRGSRAPPQEGDVIEVYWSDDKRYYRGTIGPYDPDTKKFRVDYTDGDVEDLDLDVERWRIARPDYTETASVVSVEEEEEEEEDAADNHSDGEQGESGQEQANGDTTHANGNVHEEDHSEDQVMTENGDEPGEERQNLPSNIPTNSQKSDKTSSTKSDSSKQPRQRTKIVTPQRRQSASAAQTTTPFARAGARATPASIISGRAAGLASASASAPASVPTTPGNKAISADRSAGARQTAATRAVPQNPRSVGTTSVTAGDGAKTKKTGKTTPTSAKGGKKQGKITTAPRKSTVLVASGRKEMGSGATVANGHIATNGAAPTYHQGATKRARAAVEPADKRPRKEARQSAREPIGNNVAQISMMTKLSIEASKNLISTVVAPLSAKVAKLAGKHDALQTHSDGVAKAVTNVVKQLGKIEESCSAEKFDETMTKRIGKAVADLRLFIKDALDVKERATQQALAALQTRVTALEVEQKKLAAEIGKVPGIAAEQTVAQIGAEVAKMQATVRDGNAKNVQEMKRHVDNARRPLFDSLRAMAQSVADKAAADAARAVLSTALPRAVEAQLAKNVDRIVAQIVAQHPRLAYPQPHTAPAPAAPTLAQRTAPGFAGLAPTPPRAGAGASAGAAVAVLASGGPRVPPKSPVATNTVQTGAAGAHSAGSVSGALARGAGASASGALLSIEQKLQVAKMLVGRAATIWLLEDTDRSAPPVQQALRREWASQCCTLCFRHVSGSLAKFSDPDEAMRVLNASLCVDDVDLEWFLTTPINAASIEKARLNYSSWDPPLCNDEWHAEASVLKELAQRFAVAQGRTNMRAADSALTIAIAVTHAAANVD